jgi:hypothetical protein
LLFTFPPVLAAQELFMDRQQLVPAELDRVYVKGMNYLAGQLTGDQRRGRDMYANQPGVVGLAVVAILAHGDDPNFGPYSVPVRAGLDRIMRERNEQSGYIGSSMYNHGFATLALAEAYGAVDDPRLGPALRKAVDLIVQSQAQNSLGGWRYSPNSHDADTTVSGAQMVALIAARNAGIAVPRDAIKKGLAFYERCAVPGGGFGYTNPSGPNNPRAAIGALVYALSKRKDAAEFKETMRFLAQNPHNDGGYPMYYHYYAAQAFFHGDMEAWQAWNHRHFKWLAQSQNPDGSWDGRNGTVFSTSAALLSLALNYRFLPIYER